MKKIILFLYFIFLLSPIIANELLQDSRFEKWDGTTNNTHASNWNQIGSSNLKLIFT